jgi:hypothetical protein
MGDESEITVSCDWVSIGKVRLETDGIGLPNLPEQAGVYQWIFRHGGRERRYVGEAANLRKRFTNYRLAADGRRTDQRMNDRAVRVLQAGGEVEIHLAVGVRVSTNGNRFDDLNHVHARRLVENAVLVELLAGEREVINDRGYGSLRKDPVLG